MNEIKDDVKQKLEQIVSDIITRHKRSDGDSKQFRSDLITFQNRVIKNCSLALINEALNNGICNCSDYVLLK